MTEPTPTAAPVKRPRKRPYWYFQHFDECVLCGHEDNYRERRYGRKPRSELRYEYTQSACGVHFA